MFLRTTPFDKTVITDRAIAVDHAVREYQCDESDLRFPHLQYPDEIEW